MMKIFKFKIFCSHLNVRVILQKILSDQTLVLRLSALLLPKTTGKAT